MSDDIKPLFIKLVGEVRRRKAGGGSSVASEILPSVATQAKSELMKQAHSALKQLNALDAAIRAADAERQSAALFNAFSIDGQQRADERAAAFDAETAQQLKQCAALIDQLKEASDALTAEAVRKQRMNDALDDVIETTLTADSAAKGESNAQSVEHVSLVVLYLLRRLDALHAMWSGQRRARLDVVQYARSSTSASVGSADSGGERSAALLSSADGERETGGEHSVQFSESEQQVLMSENRALLSKLRTDVDAARELERSVTRIGTLQRFFADKVAEQAEQIEHVQTVMNDANVAVSRGNEELTKAAARAVDFRIFVLMFLITATIGLLFLDWYQV